MSKPWYVCSCSWCRSQRTSTKSCRTCVNTSTPASPTSPVSWCLTRASKWPPTHTLMEELQVHVLWRFHSVLRSSTSTSVCLPVDAFHKDFHTLSLFFSSETGTRHRVHQFQPSWISFLCFFSVIPLTNRGGKYVTTQPVQGWALMNCAGAGGALELLWEAAPEGNKLFAALNCLYFPLTSWTCTRNWIRPSEDSLNFGTYRSHSPAVLLSLAV